MAIAKKESAFDVSFSELYKLTSPAMCTWSPDGKKLAVAVKHRLVIRSSSNLKIMHVFTCDDNIESIEWSPDSTLILCGLFSASGAVQVWSLEDEKWFCRITEGVAGMVHCRFAPDSRHLITAADFKLHLTCWSLVDQKRIYIKSPKSLDKGLCFSGDGRFTAVLQREKCKDGVSIYACDQWGIIRYFPVATMDAEEILWSGNNRFLCVRDTCLDYNIVVYAVTGQLLAKYKAYDNSLGVLKALWSPCCTFLAVSSFDSKIRVLHNRVWKPAAILSVGQSKLKKTARTRLYQEMFPHELAERADKENLSELDALVPPAPPMSGPSATSSRLIEVDTIVIDPKKMPLKPKQKPRTDGTPRKGVSHMCWSANSRYLAASSRSQPHMLWVWDIGRLCCAAVFAFMEPVRTIHWSGHGNALAICSGSKARTYLWEPDCMRIIPIPTASFIPKAITWSPDDKAVLLKGKSHFCVFFPRPDEDVGDEKERVVGDASDNTTETVTSAH